MSAKTGNWHNYQIKWLQENEENAAEYLNAALEDGDREGLLVALRNIAEARGGMAAVAEKSQVPRESLYRMLSKRGNPALSNLLSVLHGMGLKMVIQTKTQTASPS